MDECCNGGSPQGALLALLVRLLFLENSRPVHRPLLACVRQLPPQMLALFRHAFDQQASTTLNRRPRGAQSAHENRTSVSYLIR